MEPQPSSRKLLDQVRGALRAKQPKRLPTVLTQEETRRLLGQLSGTHGLMARLLYGSGLRLMECLRLRVKDLEFGRRAVRRLLDALASCRGDLPWRIHAIDSLLASGVHWLFMK